MGKSLFRVNDILELCIIYMFMFFLNVLFDYVKTIDIDSYILKAFLKNFMDYQTLIIFLFTLIVLVFHYQILHRKKTEIYCRILVGDTIFNIAIRYLIDCLMILGVVYLLFTFLNCYLKLKITSNLYLVLIFIIYILISESQVWRYENL